MKNTVKTMPKARVHLYSRQLSIPRRQAVIVVSRICHISRLRVIKLSLKRHYNAFPHLHDLITRTY
jgi:hypothetical protein